MDRIAKWRKVDLMSFRIIDQSRLIGGINQNITLTLIEI